MDYAQVLVQILGLAVAHTPEYEDPLPLAERMINLFGKYYVEPKPSHEDGLPVASDPWRIVLPEELLGQPA